MKATGLGTVLLLLLGLAPAAAKAGAAVTKPNIVLIMVDQWRGDALGAAGHKAVKTPHLDKLAGEGALFTRAYSSTPSCTPARAALLTGLAPWHHGMLGYGVIAGHYAYELPRALNDAGYFTCCLGKTHYTPMRETHGFQKLVLDQDPKSGNPADGGEYQVWFDKVSGGKPQNPPGVTWNDYKDYVYAYPEEWHPTAWMGRRAAELIGEAPPDRPFFIKISFTRPHSPYDPPRRIWEMYRDEAIPAAVIGEWARRYAEVKQPVPLTTWHGDLGAEQARKSRRSYYASMTFVDEQVGRIVQALQEKGVYEHTLVLFIADHGDMVGDHNLWRKTYAYEGSARIPLIVRWPEAAAPGARRGQVLRQPVEIRDVLPTFLDVAGVAAPAFLDGASLLKLVRDEHAPWRKFLDLEHSACYPGSPYWNALTDGEWKYIYFPGEGTEHLFDLGSDPGETKDLSREPTRAPVLAEWRRRLAAHLAERGEPFVKDGMLLKHSNVLYSPYYTAGYPATAAAIESAKQARAKKAAANKGTQADQQH